MTTWPTSDSRRNGPLALLPLDGGRCALVLTLSRATRAGGHGVVGCKNFSPKCSADSDFASGRFLKVGRRVPYPLSLTRAMRTSAGRCVIIGNAAQGLHPVAGMGFNLGLRDVASLAELIAENAAQADADPGSAALLARVRCLARCGSRRRHRFHRRAGPAICQSTARRCGGCATWGCWRSICCLPRRPRCRA